MIIVEESTRRLPKWMLGVSVTADNDNNNKKNITDEPEDEEDEANLAKNSKFEAKRRKRNQVKDNKELDDDTDNDVNKKTSNRPGRKRKSKSKAEIKAEYEKEEGEELTVEDLVSIAEEYVKADEDSRRKQTSGRECKLQGQLPATASSKNDLEESFIVLDGKHISAGCETTSYGSAMNLVSEESLISSSRTGDPAHDMLDLFLGPLLKKPMEKEKRSAFTTMDADFTVVLKKKGHDDFGDEKVPPMKKKSSLKDKVSLLLD
ncbi:PREDICTED: rRNA biogenesis protein RRP36 [Populus euphratica]|uniref:rRNA biogenesis protein RRP36 n=1 Tax=Populus euphratica TaxID=75702 RepID=A0AAJ6U9S2_POPEU|nr:PREDICTED: rRNA biogenesis protein RRP36 [Populus euphratica]